MERALPSEDDFVINLREMIMEDFTNAVFDFLRKSISDKDFVDFLKDKDNECLSSKNIVSYNELINNKLKQSGIAKSLHTSAYSKRELHNILSPRAFLVVHDVYKVLRYDFFRGKLGALLGDKQKFSGAYRSLIASVIIDYLSRSNQFFVNVQKEKAEKGELSKKLNDTNSKLIDYEKLVSNINDEKKEAKEKVYAFESKIKNLQEELNKYKGTSDLPTPPSITGEKDEVAILKSAEDRLKEEVSKLKEKLKDLERCNNDLKSELKECKRLLLGRDLNIEYLLKTNDEYAKKIDDLRLKLDKLEDSEGVTNRACEKYRQIFKENCGLKGKVAKLEKQVSELSKEKEYLVNLIKYFTQQKQNSNKTSNFDNKFNHDSSVSKIKQRSYSSSK